MNSKLTAEGIMGAAMRMDIQEITLNLSFQNEVQGEKCVENH